MKMKVSALALVVTGALLAGCANQPESAAPKASENKTAVAEQNESAKANKMFDDAFMARVMRSPMFQGYLGIKKDQDKWDDISDANAKKELAITKQQLADLKKIDYDKLDTQTKLSYDLAKQSMEDEIADFKWRFHDYPLNQMGGLHSQIPAFLINQHPISNVEDAKAYISRLHGVPKLFEQLKVGLDIRTEKGIMAPKFTYKYVISDSKNILKGEPFDEGEDSTIWADFKSKVDKLDIDKKQKNALLYDAKQAMVSSVKPAYNDLIAYVETLASKADARDGAWKLPQGAAFYNNALQRTTTTELTADEIHQIGLEEVARIHDEMRQIMKKTGFKGTLQEFFKFMRHDKQFYYPTTEEGRTAYLNEATAMIDNMKSRLDELFIVKPKADLLVKRVEAFREKSVGKAFYQPPSMDGSRPGLYYANLFDMADMPTYQMEALAYHEGIPGHHMQIAIAQELEGLPMFRKFGRYTAYTEGWGLYSEYIPKEMGLYEDPYSDFGRLAMELWRACRLVVDTGIHAKQWTREQAINYQLENTPNSKTDTVKAIERYILWPSQATAYKIGMLKILELREQAKQKMGSKFDIREFHDVVLKNGPVPLTVLESKVKAYIQSK
ncbi:DUF885 family protein [Pleionea sp. CnH1-48]|uniref:DUF885 domain-containing protein n=1 Tax=Pleionea sp. CnH1-48 TaxID=2954494 RepID=UPI0020972024|nr:DUF885 domain-containing protein [Pleionea sp. CnH1-48]MCO7222982.1 DUF885 domain-containing protein [Pleionea sp. CnH1-48]